MSYLAKESLVQQRQLKVQRLVIPFQVVGSATAADVSITSDEPGFVFFESEGVDQITGALETNETATYTDGSPGDSAGELNVLVKLDEDAEKVMGGELYNRDADGFAAQSGMVLNLGSATGITTGSGGGKSLMLSIDTGADHTTGTHTRCLVVEYVTGQ